MDIPNPSLIELIAEDDEREMEILELANEQRAKDGEIEQDEGTVRRSDLVQDPKDPDLLRIPVVSEGDDNGAYVRMWCWVDFAGTSLDKEGEDEEDEEGS